MKIIVAPDKFKGSLSALAAAESMMRGARDVYPAASFSLRPMADGGEGSLDALLIARGGRTRDVAVEHPLGATVNAAYGILSDGTACLEMAQASGLQLLGEDQREPLVASSAGTGTLIAAALEEKPDRLVVAVGGSASTDGGTGAARALGWRFLDATGKELPPGGGSLVDLSRIARDRAILPPTTQIIGACDVDSPLLGPRGAAHRFAPQKGADRDQVEILEAALDRLADQIKEDLGIDVASFAGAGAGGGMGAGLVAFFGAELRSGFELIAEAAELEKELSDADLVLTGEGRLDEQSLSGKVPVGIAGLAKRAHVPCVAIVGDLQLSRTQQHAVGFEMAVGLRQTGGSKRGEADPSGAIEVATKTTLRHRLDKRTGRRLRARPGGPPPRARSGGY